MGVSLVHLSRREDCHSIAILKISCVSSHISAAAHREYYSKSTCEGSRTILPYKLVVQDQLHDTIVPRSADDLLALTEVGTRTPAMLSKNEPGVWLALSLSLSPPPKSLHFFKKSFRSFPPKRLCLQSEGFQFKDTKEN